MKYLVVAVLAVSLLTPVLADAQTVRDGVSAEWMGVIGPEHIEQALEYRQQNIRTMENELNGKIGEERQAILVC